MKRLIIIGLGSIVFLSLFFLTPRILVYAYGFYTNIDMALQLNEKLIGFKSPALQYCKLNDRVPWNAEPSGLQCVVVRGAHERHCSFWTRATNCFVFQVPSSYANNPAFLKALQIEISQQLGGWHQWAYLLVQDTKPVVITTSRTAKSSTGRQIVKIERVATYKITSGGKEGRRIGGPLSECYGDQEYCIYDEDIDISVPEKQAN